MRLFFLNFSLANKNLFFCTKNIPYLFSQVSTHSEKSKVHLYSFHHRRHHHHDFSVRCYNETNFQSDFLKLSPHSIYLSYTIVNLHCDAGRRWMAVYKDCEGRNSERVDGSWKTSHNFRFSRSVHGRWRKEHFVQLKSSGHTFTSPK